MLLVQDGASLNLVSSRHLIRGPGRIGDWGRREAEGRWAPACAAFTAEGCPLGAADLLNWELFQRQTGRAREAGLLVRASRGRQRKTLGRVAGLDPVRDLWQRTEILEPVVTGRPLTVAAATPAWQRKTATETRINRIRMLPLDNFPRQRPARGGQGAGLRCRAAGRRVVARMDAGRFGGRTRRRRRPQLGPALRDPPEREGILPPA